MTNEQEVTDLPVVGMDENVTQFTQVSEEIEEEAKPLESNKQENEDSTEPMDSSEKESGRVMFRGEDMAFLTINGIQMFTLYEIMRKFCPGWNAGTVGNRFTRLHAARHACSREEIVRVKELGGTDQKFYNCSLVARADVERYCDKYPKENTGKSQVERKTRSCKSDKKITKKSTSDQESNNIDPVSCIVVSSGDLVLGENETDNKMQDLTCDNNNNLKVDEDSFRAKPKQNKSLKKIKDTSDNSAKSNHSKEKKQINKKKKKQIIQKDKPSLVKGSPRKKNNSKSALPIPKAKSRSSLKKNIDNSSLEVSTVATSNSVSEQNTPPQDDKSPNSQKRKRRTQFELLQTQSYSVVGDDDIHKRYKKASVSDADDIICDKNNFSEKLLLQETKFDYDNLDLPYLDDNNNNVSPPRSPTLLLKRLQNNKWHVAKAVLPDLSFDETQSEEKSDREIKVKNKKKSGGAKKATAMTKVKDKLKVKQKQKISKATTKEFSGKKTKVDEDDLPLASRKMFGKKKNLKKINESNKRKSSAATIRQKKLSEQEETSKFEEKLCPDIDTTDIKTKPDDTHLDVQPENSDVRKSSVVFKDNAASLNKTADNTENKDKRECNANHDGKVVKKKRRRPAQENTFRLIETIPYPSLLVVKNGDICPSFSMAYNEKNYLPGCCHPLWRWRLGKPVRIPSQSPVKTNQDERVKADVQNNENEEISTVKVTEDDLTKEDIIIDVSTVSIVPETHCDEK